MANSISLVELRNPQSGVVLLWARPFLKAERSNKFLKSCAFTFTPVWSRLEMTSRNFCVGNSKKGSDRGMLNFSFRGLFFSIMHTKL